MRGIFEVIKSFIWGSQNQFSNQYQILIQKDPYNASKGVDDFGGFVDRLFQIQVFILVKGFIRFWDLFHRKIQKPIQG